MTTKNNNETIICQECGEELRIVEDESMDFDGYHVFHKIEDHNCIPLQPKLPLDIENKY